MFGNSEFSKSMSRLGSHELMKPKRRLTRKEQKKNAAMKLIHVILTEIIHSVGTPIINSGYDFITNINQDQASTSTGTSVVVQ